jgi:hypothetical protein
MNMLEPLGEVWARVCLGMLTFNGFVAITCLIAGPHRWARLLCKTTSQVNIILTFLVMGAGKSGTPELVELGFGQFLCLFLPVVGEYLALLAISRWRLCDHSSPWLPN